MDLDPTLEDTGAAHEGGGAPTPLGRAPCLAGPPWLPRRASSAYITPYTLKLPEKNRSGVLPPEASVATKNKSRPVPAPCQRGKSLSGGHLHHPGALHDEEGVLSLFFFSKTTV